MSETKNEMQKDENNNNTSIKTEITEEKLSGTKRRQPEIKTEGTQAEKKKNVGPPKPEMKKKKQLEFEQLYLSLLPNAELYEISYDHSDVVSFVNFSNRTEFLISASNDGHVLFWKKQPESVEFVKDFKSHLGEISGCSISFDGQFLVTVALDKTLKVYDINSFDMINMARLTFVPNYCEFISKSSGSVALKVAVSDKNSGNIHIIDALAEFEEETATSLYVIETHKNPVILIRFNPSFQSVVSVDSKGMIEYWSASDYGFPSHVHFEYKSETSLYEFVKNQTFPISLNFSQDGKQFVCLSKDRQVRIFSYLSGKMTRKYDESVSVYQKAQKDENNPDRLDNIEFGRRMTLERELDTIDLKPGYFQNAVFDQSGHFVIYPTIFGIKIVNTFSNKLVRWLGKKETSRYMSVALFQGKTIGSVDTNNLKVNADYDPTIAVTTLKKNRVALFTRREPDLSQPRDLMTEKTDDVVENATTASSHLAKRCVIHTSLGDIYIKLFPKEAPKAVENFTQHSKNGYYSNHIFHRVIRNFMIQTGDPSGDGTGGKSIWGKPFEDEFDRNLTFDSPGMLAMANAGANTNGSQFFITTVNCRHLDHRHTIFGKVFKGMETVQKIERVATHKKTDKPFQDILIINIDVYFDEVD